jgi:hypothetical protein
VHQFHFSASRHTRQLYWSHPPPESLAKLLSVDRSWRQIIHTFLARPGAGTGKVALGNAYGAIGDLNAESRTSDDCQGANLINQAGQRELSLA